MKNGPRARAVARSPRSRIGSRGPFLCRMPGVVGVSGVPLRRTGLLRPADRDRGLLCRFGISQGVFLSFAITSSWLNRFIGAFTWGMVAPGIRAAKAYHLAHHMRPNARFNIFLATLGYFAGDRQAIESLFQG